MTRFWPAAAHSQPVMNIRNVMSPHWQGWFGVRKCCVVPSDLVLRMRRHQLEFMRASGEPTYCCPMSHEGEGHIDCATVADRGRLAEPVMLGSLWMQEDISAKGRPGSRAAGVMA
jgi:hypothetical protein